MGSHAGRPPSRVHDDGGDSGTALPASGGSRRLLVVLPNVGIGGAQRVACAMSNYWIDRGDDVTLVTWSVDAGPDFFSFHPRVKRMRLPEPANVLRRARRYLARRIEANWPSRAGSQAAVAADMENPVGKRPLDSLRHASSALLRLRDAVIAFIARHRLLGGASAPYARLLRLAYWSPRTLRRVLVRAEPDVVLSLLGSTNIITVAASAGLRHRTVISERNDPSKQRLEAPWDDLREVLYPAADSVSANSHGALEAMRAYCPAPKLFLMPNPLVATGASDGTARSNAMLFLARIVPQKAPDVLIEAFARFHRNASDWGLHVAGDGPLAVVLQERVRALGLDGQVTFHGTVADPTPLLARCRVFVLPSRFEGTPNALLEAMAHRMACIVSDASPGPLRLIEDGVNGLVVAAGSTTALAAAMALLSRDEQLQRRLGDAAFERVREFGLDRVGPVWDRILFPPGN